MVVLSETFFPGWKATVDGRAVPIYEADGALRGVVVEAGLHRIDIRYRPISVYAGAFLTALGLLAAMVLIRAASLRPAVRRKSRQVGDLPHGAIE
jgi:uncharacterized membrane protein YfhO